MMTVMEPEVAEFVGGPRDGAAIPHFYEAPPKFVMVDPEGTLNPLMDQAIRMYIRLNDGRYHYTELT